MRIEDDIRLWQEHVHDFDMTTVANSVEPGGIKKKESGTSNVLSAAFIRSSMQLSNSRSVRNAVVAVAEFATAWLTSIESNKTQAAAGAPCTPPMRLVDGLVETPRDASGLRDALLAPVEHLRDPIPIAHRVERAPPAIPAVDELHERVERAAAAQRMIAVSRSGAARLARPGECRGKQARRLYTNTTSRPPAWHRGKSGVWPLTRKTSWLGSISPYPCLPGPILPHSRMKSTT